MDHTPKVTITMRPADNLHKREHEFETNVPKITDACVKNAYLSIGVLQVHWVYEQATEVTTML